MANGVPKNVSVVSPPLLMKGLSSISSSLSASVSTATVPPHPSFFSSFTSSSIIVDSPTTAPVRPQTSAPSAAAAASSIPPAFDSAFQPWPSIVNSKTSDAAARSVLQTADSAFRPTPTTADITATVSDITATVSAFLPLDGKSATADNNDDGDGKDTLAVWPRVPKLNASLGICFYRMNCERNDCCFVHGEFDPSQNKIEKDRHQLCVYQMKGRCGRHESGLCTFRHLKYMAPLSRDQEELVEQKLAEKTETIKFTCPKPKILTLQDKTLWGSRPQIIPVKRTSTSAVPKGIQKRPVAVTVTAAAVIKGTDDENSGKDDKASFSPMALQLAQPLFILLGERINYTARTQELKAKYFQEAINLNVVPIEFLEFIKSLDRLFSLSIDGLTVTLTNIARPTAFTAAPAAAKQ